ncbi:MAG: orotate phosphoribosyltransferase [Verrucomicrobiales bacterium]|nr:orotate phosphoribosyltransferase [Verrucomicrobiales bacterium]
MQPQEPPANDHTWIVLCHASALLVLVPVVHYGALAGPLIVWLVKRDSLPDVNSHGRAALNFQISMTLYSIAAVTVPAFLIGNMPVLKLLPWALGWVLLLANLICIITASLKAGRGELFRYPFAIPFLPAKT